MAGRKKRVGPVNYYEVPRKQLQSLCKKYGFPANKTNQLMAEFLTAHLNSEEYLNRDMSLPSPAVKTIFQCRDSEGTTDDSLPSISESQPAVSEMQTRNLSHVFGNDDGAQTDRTLVSSETKETCLAVVTQTISPQKVAGSIVVEESMDFTMAVDKSQDSCLQSERESDQAATIPLSTSGESMDFTIAGSEVRCSSQASGSETPLPLAYTSEKLMDFTTPGPAAGDSSLKSERAMDEETPLPLSVVPYVCRLSPPEGYTSSSNRVELFIDLKNDSFPTVDRLFPGETQCSSLESVRAPGQGTPVPESETSEKSMDFTALTPVTGDPFSELELGQDTPVPLSVMPYVCLVTPPEGYTSSDKQLELFVDLSNDSLPRSHIQLPDGSLNISIYGDRPRDFYQVWGAPPSMLTDKMHDHNILGSITCLEGTERNLAQADSRPDAGLDRRLVDGPLQKEETRGLLLEPPSATICSKTAVAAPLKSSLLTSTNKPMPYSKVSFVSDVVLPSPRSMISLVSDAQRSDIVEEWSVDKNLETLAPIDQICQSSREGNAADDELVLREVDENVLTQKHLEINESTQACAADVETPPEGIVKTVVKIYEEDRRARRSSSISRKDSYKNSPFVKSSRVAVDLERASKLGQTRRVGILAVKRAMGLAPLFSGPDDVEAQHDTGSSPASGSPSQEAVMSDANMSDGNSSDSPVGASSGSLSQEAVMSDANTSDGNSSDSPVEASDCVAVEVRAISETEILQGGKPGMVVDTESLPVSGGAFQNETLSREVTASSMEGPPGKDELTVVESDTDARSVLQNEAVMFDKSASLPVTVEESATNLSWMTKPIQLPTRKPTNRKLKEKAGRVLSANGRKFELMERAAAGRVAKLKAWKKSATPRDEEPTTCSSVSTDAEEPNVRGCGRQADVEEHIQELDVVESIIMEVERAENPAGIFSLLESETKTSEDEIQPAFVFSQLESVDLPKSSERHVGEKCTKTLSLVHSKSSASDDGTSICKDLTHNANTTLEVDEEDLNIQSRADTTDSGCREISDNVPIFCEVAEKIEEGAEEPIAVFNFLNVDFEQMREGKTMETPPPKKVLGLLDIDFTKVRETHVAEKPTALSPIDINRWAIDTALEGSPNPSTPIKAGIPVVQDVYESEGKENNASGLAMYGKENEWMKRQEQHKTPLTGRSKEKALRTAEKKAWNLREQLLRKRRGMEQQPIDSSDAPSIQSIQFSPFKQLALSRLL